MRVALSGFVMVFFVDFHILGRFESVFSLLAGCSQGSAGHNNYVPVCAST